MKKNERRLEIGGEAYATKRGGSLESRTQHRKRTK